MYPREYYVTDSPPSHNVAQGHFVVGSHAQIETHAQLFKKIFGPSVFPYLGASGAEKSTQHYNADITWGGGRPGDQSSITYPARMPDGPAWDQIESNVSGRSKTCLLSESLLIGIWSHVQSKCRETN